MKRIKDFYCRMFHWTTQWREYNSEIDVVIHTTHYRCLDCGNQWTREKK